MSQWLDSRSAVRVGQVVAAAEAALLATWVVAPDAAVALGGGGGGGGVPTKPTTALALLLIGAVIGWPALSRRVVAAMLTLAAGLAVEGALSGTLDQPLLSAYRLFPPYMQEATPGGSGQMAVTSALCVLLLTTSLAVGAGRSRRTTGLGLTAFSLAYVGLLGHLYGLSGLFMLQTPTSMAAPTAVAGLALATAVVLRDDRLPVLRALRARGTAGALLRSLVGWALLVPPLAAWVVVRAIGQGWADAAFGMALLAVLSAAGGVLLVLIGATTAARVDRAREAAAAELEALNAVLSERVATAVAAAEEGRERLGFLLDGTPVGIFETSPDGVRRYANQRWRELTGLSDSQVADTNWDSVLHPDDRDWVAASWAEAVESGSEYSARYRYLRPDGEVTWVDATALAVRAADGRVNRWLGSVTDVTDQVLAAERLSQSERRYRSVVATMAEGVVLLDHEGSIVTVNDAACRLLGYEPEQLVGMGNQAAQWNGLRDDGSLFPRDEHPSIVALRTGRAVRDVTMGVARPDGRLVWLSVSSEPLADVDGPPGERRPDGVVTTFADITGTRSATAALRRSEAQFRHAMALAPIGMALVELDGRFREVNRSLARLVGYDESELLQRTFQQITHPDDVEADVGNVSRLIDGSLDHYTMEKRYLTKAGEIVWVLLAVSLARDEKDRPSYLIAQMQDITDTRAAQERLEHRALHDPLTGLPNRDLVMDHLSHTLARSARSGSMTAVMFCDLDHFKTVNDTYGHEAGDQLLVAVADRLRSVMRPGDSVGRLGGDEFVVVAESMADASVVRSLAERVREALDEPIQVGAHLVRTGVSIGVAVAGASDDARSVLRQADAAMYRAKALGRGRLEVSSDASVWDGRERRVVPAPLSAVPDPQRRGA